VELNPATLTVSPASIAEVSRLGDDILRLARDRAPLRAWPRIALDDVFFVVLMGELLSPEAAFALAVSYTSNRVEHGDLSESSALKAAQIQARFIAYVRSRFGVDDVRLVGRDAALAFTNTARLGEELRAPAAQTRRNRRWALDRLFTTWRALGIFDGDPVLDVKASARASNSGRPLLESELRRCERYARISGVNDTLGPARLALAEATATTGEIANVVAADVTSDGTRVWLSGGRFTPRWGHLTEWGARAVRARLNALNANERDVNLAYEGAGANGRGQSSVCIGLRRILDAASLSDNPSVRPGSIRAWAGRSIWDEAGDIEEVRHRLGLRGLDDARKLIGIPWGQCDLPPAHRATPPEVSS
jgi:hypothetical protein